MKSSSTGWRNIDFCSPLFTAGHLECQQLPNGLLQFSVPFAPGHRQFANDLANAGIDMDVIGLSTWSMLA